MKLNLTIFSFFSFLFFSAMMKTNKEWNLIRFVFHSADFADCYQFSQNDCNRPSFWIVIWESVILIKLVEMIEISTAFAKHVLNLLCFLSSSFRFEDCWKGAMWKEVWNLLVRNNWWNSRKNEWKVWFFAFVKLDETPSRLDWLNGWNWLQSNKQRFRQRQNSIFIIFFQRVREMRFSLVLPRPFCCFRHFSNDFFESRSI